jgi:hypothetical protein
METAVETAFAEDRGRRAASYMAVKRPFGVRFLRPDAVLFEFGT